MKYLVCGSVCVLSHFSCVQLFVTSWTRAHQAPLSLGFCRQKYWSGLLFPSPGDLLDPGIKPVSPVAPALQAESHGRHPLMCKPMAVSFQCMTKFTTNKKKKKKILCALLLFCLCFPNKPNVIFSLWIC